jgi:hypothetical protein
VVGVAEPGGTDDPIDRGPEDLPQQGCLEDRRAGWDASWAVVCSYQVAGMASTQAGGR